MAASPDFGPGASPVATLRSGDVRVPFLLDFAPDIAPGDALSSASVRVFAQGPPAGPTPQGPHDVTATILQSSTLAGSVVSALLGNANAQPGTLYSVRVLASLASGETVQEDISPILCDS